MILNFFKNSRKSLFSFIILFSIISLLIFLITIKQNKKLFNQNLINSSKTLYLDFLKSNFTFNNDLNMVPYDYNYSSLLLPFSVEILNDSLSNKRIEFIDEKKLMINKYKFDDDEFSNILNIISQLSLNQSLNSTYSDIGNINSIYNEKLFLQFYKHINIYFLIHEEEDTNIYNSIIMEKLNEIEIDFKIYIKFLFYDKFKGVTKDNFYEDLKIYNSKSIFEELKDESYLNLIIYNDENNEFKLRPYYNHVLKQDIWFFNIKEFSLDILKKMIVTNVIPHNIKYLIKNEDVLTTVIQLTNSCNFRFFNFMIYALNSMDKINKIFYLYETIRTNDKVKEKINKINSILIKTVTNKFKCEDLDFSMISDIKYLMDSNELVSYEHYFSNEFKIGMFLPSMLPISYALIKAIKALR